MTLLEEFSTKYTIRQSKITTFLFPIIIVVQIAMLRTPTSQGIFKEFLQAINICEGRTVWLRHGKEYEYHTYFFFKYPLTFSM